MTVVPIAAGRAPRKCDNLSIRIGFLLGCAVLSAIALAVASDGDSFGSFYFISWASIWGFVGSHTSLDQTGGSS